MPEDPFRHRPEDFLNKGLKAAVGALPVIGSPLAEFFNFVVGDPAQERRDDFMKEVQEKIIRLTDQHDELRTEKLRANVQFQATFVQAAQAVVRTAQEQKIEM